MGTMSVLVRGMEMPKNCHSCPMCLMRFCQARDRELSERETRPNAKRPEDCPLLPVPPHGRLIDADALDSSETDYLGNHLVYLVDIDDAPTIIPAEEGET